MNDAIFAGLDREVFDKHNDYAYQDQFDKGLNEQLIRSISKDKEEPEWMLEFRLKALQEFRELKFPKWGPDLQDLDLEQITYFAKADANKNAKSWD